MKSNDLKMVAAYLSQEEVFDDFAVFLETQYDIDAATEAGVIVESIEIGADALAMIEKQHPDCTELPDVDLMFCRSDA